MIFADEEATRAFGATLAPLLRAGDVVLLSGPLGAGKTTLVRGLLGALGHVGEVPSPSFAIVQPYEELPMPLWHVDLYRISDPSEIEELGLDTVLGEGALIVDWPDRAGAGAWPPTALILSIAQREDGSRALTAQPGEGWESRWPPR